MKRVLQTNEQIIVAWPFDSNAKEPSNTLDAALLYASRGWKVFPIKPNGKEPISGFKWKEGATSDPNKIRKLWKENPNAGIGLPTGETNGVWVLDLDSKEAIDKTEPFLRGLHTLTAQTAKGLHVYFKHAPGLRNSASKAAAQVDVRGKDGYVILPPSIHPTGTAYAWKTLAAPVEAPPELLELVKREKTTPATPAPAPVPYRPMGASSVSTQERQLAGYQVAALEDAEREIRKASAGTRNDTLNKQAFSVAGLNIPRDVIEARLGDAARVAGLPEQEIQKTLKSALSKGSAAPRAVELHPSEPPRAATRKTTPATPSETEKAEPNLPGPRSFDEMLTLQTEPRAVICGDWLKSGGLAMVAGDTGTGKSWFALDLAMSVACGVDFIKWSVPESRKVLYIDGEMEIEEIKERLVLLREAKEKAAGHALQPRLNYFADSDAQRFPEGLPRLSTAEGLALVEKHIDGVSLVILDNLSTLFNSTEENDAASWVGVQDWLLSLRRRGIAALFVHHTGKGGAQRGTSKREDTVNTSILLTHPENWKASDGARFNLKFTKARGCRGSEVDPFSASLLTDEAGVLVWQLSTKAIDLSAEILALRDEDVPIREIATKLKLSKSAVERVLKKQSTHKEPPGLSRVPPLKGGGSGTNRPKTVSEVGTRAGQDSATAYSQNGLSLPPRDKGRDNTPSKACLAPSSLETKSETKEGVIRNTEKSPSWVQEIGGDDLTPGEENDV